MPTIRAHEHGGYVEATFPEVFVARGNATEREVLVNYDWFEPFQGSLSATGFSRPRLYEREASIDWGIPKTSVSEFKGYDGFVVTLNNGTRMSVEPFDHNYRGPIARSLEQSHQRTTTGLSLLVRSQVDQIVTGFNPRLQERISQFGNDWPGKEPVSASTKSAVNEMVAWLCSQSETVSATVSNDGILSIATVFQNEVRLYVEIERDGSTEAAVTRERRYARDISGNTVAALTSEVILAALRSI